MPRSPWFKRIWVNLRGHTSPKPMGPPADLTLLHKPIAPPAEEPIAPPAGLTLLHTLEGHTDLVWSIAWSPDGRLLATGSTDYTVRLWDPSSGVLLHILGHHTGEVRSVAWSPDGRLLASAGSSDHTVRLWDPSRGTLLYTLDHVGLVSFVAWSPDGRLLASAGFYNSTVWLWDPSSGTLLHTLEGHTDRVWSVAWSPDGQLLATGSTDQTVRLWDPSRGTLLHTLEAHTSWVTSVAWSPDGRLLASAGSDDQTMRLWDPSRGTLLHTLEAHTGDVQSIAWSPDGRLLASAGSGDQTVRLWDPSHGTLLHTLEGHTDRVWSVAWSPDGRLLASETGTDVRIWRADTWEPIAVLMGLKDSAPVTWHPRLPLVVTAGQQHGNLFVWQLDLEHLLHIAPSPEVVHYANAKVVLAPEVVHYVNAKVVLVGDSGVGKSGLALVLTGRPFAPTESTHGRHVWLLDQQEVALDDRLRETRETWLWDLAGQPDYRLIHQLHLHEATVALIVFDAARDTDPFAGIRQWHRALLQAQQVRGSTLPLTILLAAARIDRGGISVSRKRIDEVVQELGCAGYVETSAKDGRGMPELDQAIQAAIDWTRLPKVTSTRLLQAVKTFVVDEQHAGRSLLHTAEDLYNAFLLAPDAPASSDELSQQFETALGRLEAQGIIRQLGFGNLILLQPERLDAYASALLVAVKKDDPDGLGSIGSIPEVRVQQGQFLVPAEERLPTPEQEKLLLIAMIDELVRQQLVLRESGSLLFPSQSTREHPDALALAGKQAVTFTFAGPVLSIYTTLVVRLAQCGIFQKQELWQHVVTYTTHLGGSYGLLLSPRGEERAELGLFFDEATDEEMRFHFEDFVQTHLECHAGGTLQRRRRFVCPTCGEAFTETQVSHRRARGFTSIRCSTCETEVSLLDGVERLTILPSSLVKTMEQMADDQRDRESAASVLQGKRATQDFDVFLCHNGQDKPVVEQIGKQLESQGILPWLDKWELRPGLPWQQLLEQQIEQIKAAAVFVGQSGIGPWQRQELSAFLREFVNRDCPVIPVLLADAPQKPELPVFLKAMTWVDFRIQDPDPIQQLLWGITGNREVDKGIRRGG